MAKQDHIAEASTTIDAPIGRVWDALTTSATIKQYMFGTEVVSDWQEGRPIVWQGEWKGRPYEDKGVLLKIDPPKLLQYTHYSGMSGAPDVPENYHTLTYHLTSHGEGTHVVLSQDNNASADEQAESQKMWEGMLAGLKQVVEAQGS